MSQRKSVGRKTLPQQIQFRNRFYFATNNETGNSFVERDMTLTLGNASRLRTTQSGASVFSAQMSTERRREP